MTWNFNALEHEPSAGLEPWPEGTFDVIITKAEEKPTRNEGGAMWVLTIKGLPSSPPVADKIQNIYIVHRHGTASVVAGAHATMAAIAVCCGVPQFQHPGQLTNIPFKVVSKLQPVKTAKKDDGTEERSGGLNEFRTFKNAAGLDAIDVWKAMKSGGMPAQGGQQQAPAGFGQPQQQPAQTMQQPQPGFVQPGQPQPGFVQPGQPMQQPQPGPGGAWPGQPQPGFASGPQSVPGYPQDGNGQPMQQPGGFPQQPAGGFQPGQPVNPAQQPQQTQQWQPGQQAQPQPGAAPWGAPQG